MYNGYLPHTWAQYDELVFYMYVCTYVCTIIPYSFAAFAAVLMIILQQFITFMGYLLL